MTIQPDPAQPTRRRLAHPSWCIKADCAHNEEHRGRWHSVDPDKRNQLAEIDLRLTQAVMSPAPTWIEIAIRVGRSREVYEVSRGQGVALRHVLGALTAEAR
jgi:hypothetical protein